MTKAFKEMVTVPQINTRYFKTYKHFVGTAEQKEIMEIGTEVINHVMDSGDCDM